MKGKKYKKEDIRATVFVLTCNHPHVLKLIVEALMKQDCEYLFEVVITDDGSSHDSFAQIEKIINESDIPMKYVWQQDKGVRPCYARNNGLRLGNADLKIFLDGDMIPEFDSVKKYIEKHDAPKKIVTGNRYWRGQITDELEKRTTDLPIEDVLEMLRNDWPLDEKSQKREEKEQERRKEWLSSDNPWRVCLGASMSFTLPPGVEFDENYFGWGNEDWEIAYRLMKDHGYTLEYDETIGAYHLETKDKVCNIFRNRDEKEIVYHMRNIIYFHDKYPEIDFNEIFWGFRRIQFDEKTDSWTIAEKPNMEEDLEEKVAQVRKWLKSHGIYP